MSFWEGLYGADMQGKILEGVKILVSCVHKVMAQQKRSPTRLLLEGAASAQDTTDDTSEEGTWICFVFWVAQSKTVISDVVSVLSWTFLGFLGPELRFVGALRMNVILQILPAWTCFLFPRFCNLGSRDPLVLTGISVW